MFTAHSIFIIWFIFLPLALVAAAFYLISRLGAKRRDALEEAQAEDAAAMEELAETMTRMERRIDALETILEDKLPPEQPEREADVSPQRSHSIDNDSEVSS